MLTNLTIKNIALIDQVELNFTQNLNVLSGETGAGKSVIIDSLNFVLGAKADKSMIRNGESQAYVKAVFTISDNSVIHQYLQDLDVDDNTIVISRKLDINGKNEIRLNGTVLSLSILKQITSKLVDLHGQSEHYLLVKESEQLALIDKLSTDIFECKQQISPVYNEYTNIIKQLNQLGGNDSDRAIRLDILKYQIEEIENADIYDGEYEELLQLREKIRNLNKITDGLKISFHSIDDEGGCLDKLQNALYSLNKISAFDLKYSQLVDKLQSLKCELEDVSATLSDYLEDFDINDEDADKIEDRIELLKKLNKKYGGNYTTIMQFLTTAKEEYERLENFDILADKLLTEKVEREKQLYKLFTNLHNIRIKVANDFSNSITQELTQLGMKNASFIVEFDDIPTYEDAEYTSNNGFDKISFYFSANKGEPVKPLAKIISGGELSRFMLAIKAQTAKIQETGTFVFDEIDVGISGSTAKIVAQKFAEISKYTQIIAISHLPQIAAMSDNGILITKTEYENTTKTEIINLDFNNKISEIARLTSGDINNKSALKLAQDMITECDNFKKTLY